MIAGGGEGIGHAREKVLAVVLDGGGFAVHHAVIDDDLRAEDMADALVAEADAKERQARAESRG